jgi:beta-glucosidase
MDPRPANFGAPFAWGAATSPYQIEGKEGRGPSVWDAFCEMPGKVFAGHNGAVACDHFTRAIEDVGHFRAAGWNAYRFGVSWSRVCPDGSTVADPRGLDYYDRLVDALLEAGIEPWITVYHWDMPLEMHRRGGWLNRDCAHWMADLAAVLAERLAGRVRKWFTMNEPQCFIGLGFFRGVHAPGYSLDLGSVLAAGHHALLGHGMTVLALRAADAESQVGWAPSGVIAVPATPDPADVEAARAACFDMSANNPLGRNEPNPLWANTWWSDPVFLGHYPEDALHRFGAAVPAIKTNDMETIHQPLDFNGAIIYTGSVVRAGRHGPEVVPMPEGFPASSLGWPVLPQSMYWGPKFLSERYPCPIVIAENGVALREWPDVCGEVNDSARVDFLHRYLAEFAKWRSEGGDARGYFHWSAMDNFEWSEGYKDRFGLIHVDFQTQKRTLKQSAHWFADVIRENGARFFKTL